MIVEFAASLPDQDDPFREVWARWQVGLVRRVVHEAAYEPLHLIIAGCIEEQAGDCPTDPRDHVPPDSIGVFYGDGDEEDAQRWARLCADATAMVGSAIDWGSVQPSAVVVRGERMGLHLRPAFPPEIRSGGQPMTVEQIDAMEEVKNDFCRVELVRWASGISSSLQGTGVLEPLVLSYTELMAGKPSEGVALRWLWQPSDTLTDALTGRPSKVVVGWGLDFDDAEKQVALTYCESWRLAFYALAGSVDWPVIDLDGLQGEARALGIISEDC